MAVTREEQSNQKHWDDVAPAHYAAYDIKTLRAGGSVLTEVELRELGDLHGKRVLHLQCHIGTDTLSLEREGAVVTGVDFSEKSISIACDLRDELGMKTEFILGNVLDLPELIQDQYDIVYTAQGVLCWIRDIETWGRNAAAAVKPGGFFYIYEYHPFAYVFDEEHETSLVPKYSYFEADVLKFDAGYGDYSNPDYVSTNPTYEWTWTVGQIQNALIRSGLRIRYWNEHKQATYKMMPFLERAENGEWQLPPEYPRIPLMFSMKADKPK